MLRIRWSHLCPSIIVSIRCTSPPVTGWLAAKTTIALSHRSRVRYDHISHLATETIVYVCDFSLALVVSALKDLRMFCRAGCMSVDIPARIGHMRCLQTGFWGLFFSSYWAHMTFRKASFSPSLLFGVQIISIYVCSAVPLAMFKVAWIINRMSS